MYWSKFSFKFIFVVVQVKNRWQQIVVSDMFQIMLITNSLINLQIRHIASVILIKASDYFSDQVFPLFNLREYFWSMFQLVLHIPACVSQG